MLEEAIFLHEGPWALALQCSMLFVLLEVLAYRPIDPFREYIDFGSPEFSLVP